MRYRRAAMLGGVAALALAACGSADLPASVAPSSATVTTLSPAQLEANLDPTCVVATEVPQGSTVHTVSSGGVERSYLQYVPASYEGVAMPVVVSLHNTGATAAEQDDASGLRDAAEADGFVLLAPQGLGDPPAWDTAAESADVAFVTDLLTQAAGDFCLAPERVYALGSGDGSDFAGRVACDLSPQVAAVAFIGVVPDPDPCEQERPVPVVAVPGFDADFTPWVERYGCDAEPVLVPFEGGTIGDIQGDFEGCVDGAAIQSLTVVDQRAGNDAIWAFLAAHPLGAPAGG